MFFFGGARRKIEGARISAIDAVAKLETPKLIDHNAVARFVLQSSKESPARWVEGVNAGIPFAEVTD